MLAAIETLLSAVVADCMSGDRHNSTLNCLLRALPTSPSRSGGIPATGAITRTATNIKSGARTPISGMVHALTLIVILLVAAPLARFIPLAAILFVVAYKHERTLRCIA
jgi:sulfate permease, SulP family